MKFVFKIHIKSSGKKDPKVNKSGESEVEVGCVSAVYCWSVSFCFIHALLPMNNRQILLALALIVQKQLNQKKFQQINNSISYVFYPIHNRKFKNSVFS